MNPKTNNRKQALLILKEVLDNGVTLENAFDKHSQGVSPVDKRFIRHLTTTTIRHLGQLDRIIDHCTKTKLGNTQMAVRHVLRLGICQLLFTEIPAHAAVNTAVNLMDKAIGKKLRYLKNTVNAVLRKVDREREELLKKYGNSRHNIPKWMLNRWDTRYGKETVKEIINQILQEAPLDLALLPQVQLDEWAIKLNAEKLPLGGLRIKNAGNIKDLPGYDEGYWWVQDLAAQLPAHLLGAKKGDEVLDICAAPGGKTLQSAASGLKVTAVDISKRRLERLHENLRRLSLKAEIIEADILMFEPKKQWQYILLDAPCSSTGTIRRHPEILWSHREDKIKSLSILQTRMLDKALELLAPGGTLIYCTCSMEMEEGPDQVNALLKRNSTLKQKMISASELPGLERSILQTGDVQTLPHYFNDGMDGFFISRLIKDKG